MIEELFENVRQHTVDLNAYSGELLDVAFDIVTAETAIAGIADQLLSGRTPSSDQAMVLDKQLLDGSIWHLIDGGTSDLNEDATLLVHAINVVSLQEKCREHILAQQKED